MADHTTESNSKGSVDEHPHQEPLKVVPQYFFKSGHQFEYLYHDYQSCVLYKSLDNPKLKSEYFVSSHVLTIVLRGKKVIQTGEGKPVVIQEGEMVFIPKDLYMIQDIVADKGNFESWLFFFSDEVINRFISTLHKGKINGFRILKEPLKDLPVYQLNESIDHFAKGIIPLFSGLGEGSKQLIEVKLMELLHLMSLSVDRKAFLEQLHSLRKGKKNVKKFMELNFQKPLKVEDYAYLTGRSLTSFLRDFKINFDATPKQWLMQRRMEKAKELFLAGDQNVTQVALTVGYENISHFIKAFKKTYTVSPKQLVMKVRRNELLSE